jgi:hypothetical protein
MATPLPPATDLTGSGVTEGGFKTAMTNIRTFLADLLGTDGVPATARAALGVADEVGMLQNMSITANVASNILTIALKTKAGADPSASSPVRASFRNVVAATGDYVAREITAALSLAVPDTALLGTANSTPFRLWVVLFDDGGTMRLGVINCLATAANPGAGRDVSAIYPLRDDVLASSTAVGTGSDSAGVIYTGSAVTGKAMRVLGFMEWASGLATAGTWSAGPTKIQPIQPGMSMPGQLVQVQRSQTGAFSSGAGTIPQDDTIPQISEGNEVMTQAIIPTSVVNALQIETQADVEISPATGFLTLALFQDATANALAAIRSVNSTSPDTGTPLQLNQLRLAATAASTTFRVRAASTSGTTYFNGSGGARRLGGVMNSYLQVSELMG